MWGEREKDREIRVREREGEKVSVQDEILHCSLIYID